MTPPSAIALFRFQESDGVLPADALGNLHDLSIDTGLAMPAMASSTFTGRGRRFVNGAHNGFVTTDASDLGTLQKHDASVQAILSLDAATSAVHTVYARGTNSGALADRIALGLQVRVTTSGMYEARLFHHDENGTFQLMPPGVFQPLGTGKLFLLTATRAWLGRDRVVVRYYVGETQIADILTSHGSIAGGTQARTTVGVRGNAGAWTDYLCGVIDELAVYNYELSPGEVRQTWRRMTQHQPAGVDMFVGLEPPGVPWYDDPGNEIGKIVKTVGQSVGLKVAAAEELKDLWLPGSPAPLDVIGRHEDLAGVVPGRLDSLDQRNARLLMLAQSPTDEAIPTMLDLFAERFGQDIGQGSAELEVIEIRNTFTPVLDSSLGATLDPELWTTDNLGNAGAQFVVSAQHRLAISSANGQDLRYAAARLGVHARMPIDVGEAGPENNSPLNKPGRWYAQTKIDDYDSLAQGTGVGMVFASLGRGEHTWLGIYRHTVAEAAPNTWDVYLRVRGRDGTVQETTLAFSLAPKLGAGVAVWLRIRPHVGVVFGGGGQVTYDLYASIEGPESGFELLSNVSTVQGAPEWMGWSIISTIAAPLDSYANVSHLSCFCPDSLRTFSWYVFRDANEYGAVNPEPARKLFQRVKHAHTVGGVCQSKSVIYDDAILGLYDAGPMGGY